jgi:hypothetical protein
MDVSLAHAIVSAWIFEDLTIANAFLGRKFYRFLSNSHDLSPTLAVRRDSDRLPTFLFSSIPDVPKPATHVYSRPPT